MLRNQILMVPPEATGARLDRFLRDRFPGLPPRSVRHAIEAGAVRVGVEKGVKGRFVQAGEKVSVEAIAEAEDWLPVSCDVPGASVAFADGHVAVLCKPHDVHTEPQRPNEEGTLASFLRSRFPGVVAIAPVPGLTLLTRLDYATSGAVPAALNPLAFEALRHEREMGRLEKRYLCLVEGEVAAGMSIDWEIDAEGGGAVRVRQDRKDPDPRRWTLIEPVRASGGTTLVRATISRGKRHQIRAHLAAAGHPVAGDRRYGAVPEEGPGRNRLMLHAEVVVFRHPVTGETVSVTCPAPQEFDVP
ncbi:MAG: Ribosomal large subunit pseudouridine synthase [Deltaproteobacteria bacterium]|nr:Ribosomal large subunit pseudouridine synthase [Deltaproteobacteria bacterium]